MDIANRTPSTRTIDIVDPATSEKVGIRVTLLSLDDEKLKKLRRKIQDRRLTLEARGKSFKAEDIEQNQLEMAYTAIVAWEWSKDSKGEDTTFGGEVPDLTRENALAVFQALPWFREQIDEVIGDTKTFFTV